MSIRTNVINEIVGELESSSLSFNEALGAIRKLNIRSHRVREVILTAIWKHYTNKRRI